MLGLSMNQLDVQQFTSEQLHDAFFSAYKTSAERITVIANLLRSPAAPLLREQVGRWVIQRLPAEELVPEKYAHWRPLVQDAMLFMFLNLSIDRLAPKL